jgi:HTH-type transcriptional regulator/antitoxin MqsA
MSGIESVGGSIMDNCPGCGALAPMHDTHGVSYTYKGQHTTIPGVAAYHCVDCGDVRLDPAAVHRYDELVARFHRKVDAALVEPAYLKAVRQKLGLDHDEADEVFGTDHFERYETGKAQPHPSTVALVKLLDRHPELLAEVRGV